MNELSDSGQYTALSWAQYGAEKGQQTDGVKEFLLQKGGTVSGDQKEPTSATSGSAVSPTPLHATGEATSSAAPDPPAGTAEQPRLCEPCGRPHTAALSAKKATDVYRAFSAAYDGCERCVRYYVTVGRVGIREKSESEGYDLMSWAKYGETMGNDTETVQRFLAEQESSGAAKQAAQTGSDAAVAGTRPGGVAHSSAGPPQDPAAGQSQLCGQEHKAALSTGRQTPLYHAFSAAYAGCLACVRHFVETGAVGVNELSNSGEFNLVSWAMYGAEKGEATDGVLQYLLEKDGLPPPKKTGSSRWRRQEEVPTLATQRTSSATLPTIQQQEQEQLYGPGHRIWQQMAAKSDSSRHVGSLVKCTHLASSGNLPLCQLWKSAPASYAEAPPGGRASHSPEAGIMSAPIVFVRETSPDQTSGVDAAVGPPGLDTPLSHAPPSSRSAGSRQGIGYQ